MLTLDLVAEEDGFSPEFDSGSQDSWEDGFRVELQAGGGREVGGRQRAGTDVSKLRATSKEPRVQTGSLPRGSERSWGKQSHPETSKVHKTPQVQVCGTVEPLLGFVPSDLMERLLSGLPGSVSDAPAREEVQRPGSESLCVHG